MIIKFIEYQVRCYKFVFLYVYICLELICCLFRLIGLLERIISGVKILFW